MGDSKAAQLQLKVHSLERELEVTKGKVKTRDHELSELKNQLSSSEVKINTLQGRLDEMVSKGQEDRTLTFSTEAFTGPRPTSAGPVLHGIRVSEVLALWSSIKDDAENYCQAHQVASAGAKCHYCAGETCGWEHRGLACERAGAAACGPLQQLVPDSHLVIDRYIRPQMSDKNTSYAEIVVSRTPPHRVLRPSTFVSHVWSEHFGSFTETLKLALGSQEVLFISGLCTDPRAEPVASIAKVGAQDVASVLARRLELQALRTCCQVMAIIDCDLQYPTRLWCSFEIATATLEGIPVVVWPHHSADLFKLRDAVQNVQLLPGAARDMEEGQSLCGFMDLSFGLTWMGAYVGEILQSRLRLFCQAFEEMTAERVPGEPLQQRDVARLRGLQQEGTARLTRCLDTSGGQLASHLYRETELLRGVGALGPHCEFGAVGGPLCNHPSYVPEVWDEVLARRVLRVHGLCLFSCNSTIVPGEGLWRVYFSVKRDADFAFDTQVILRLNGQEQSRVTIEEKVAQVGVWTPLYVGEFRQERGAYRELEAQMESVPAEKPTPKYGFYIDRMRAELVSPGRPSSAAY